MTYTTTQKIAIELFYNKDRESDVQYCKFEQIPNSLKLEILKILKL